MTIVQLTNVGSETLLSLPDLKQQNNSEIPSAGADVQWEVTLHVKRGSRGKLSKWVKVYLGEVGDEYTFLGLKRQG
jgi:hypothetical protein